MENLETEFKEEIRAFEDVFWGMAESIGYERSDENACLLMGIYLPAFLKDCDLEDRKALLEKYPHREGNMIEAALSRAFLECVIAARDNSIHFLCASHRSLGAARTLLGLEVHLNNAITSMIGFQKTVKKVYESSRRRKEDTVAKVLSDFGKKGAAAAHVETNKMKAEVVEFWVEKIDKSLSNEKAATELAKQFPLSHRTLRDYVAEAKKSLRSAGKV